MFRNPRVAVTRLFFFSAIWLLVDCAQARSVSRSVFWLVNSGACQMSKRYLRTILEPGMGGYEQLGSP